MLLRSARLPDGRVVDARLDPEGRVIELSPATGRVEAGDVDLGGRLAVPALAEPHAHLDKAFTAELVPNPAGDLWGAIEAWSSRYHERTVDEIHHRADATVELSLAKGCTAIRTHADVGDGIGTRAIEALVALRDERADEVDIQVVALCASPLTGTEGATNRRALESAVELGVDLIGACPALDPDPVGLIEFCLAVGSSAGLALDLHVDETLDPEVTTLEQLARAVVDQGFSLPVTASHCVSLSVQSPQRQAELCRLTAQAGIGVVALPATNLFLQARGVSSAPPRGIAPLAALFEAGVDACLGGDNVQDPFNTMGRADPLEAAALGVMAAHLDPDAALAGVSEWARTVTGLPRVGLEPGCRADLLVVDSASRRDLVASAPAERMVVRAGRVIRRTELITHRPD